MRLAVLAFLGDARRITAPPPRSWSYPACGAWRARLAVDTRCPRRADYLVYNIIFSSGADLKRFAGFVGAAMLVVAGATSAAAQAPTVVRGVVSDVKPNQVSVKPAKGPPIIIGLTPDWRVAVTRPISVTEIKPGSFIGSAEMPRAEG